uniref:Uncharacterized protein n=1 Tax=Arundo donax TaxID=35708 RepID=A0A0A8ZRR1_ARUDO
MCRHHEGINCWSSNREFDDRLMIFLASCSLAHVS